MSGLTGYNSGSYGGGGNTTPYQYSYTNPFDTSKSGTSPWGTQQVYRAGSPNNTDWGMSTQPVSSTYGTNSAANTGSSMYDWYNQWSGMENQPTYPSTSTGSQASTNIPGAPATTGQNAGFTWNVPDWIRGLNAQQWGTPEMGQAAQNYTAISLPFSQLQQNAYQYGQDFNENQRRWDQQFGWTQTTDQFNMNLAQQQQAMADWVARNQQGNWQQQFGLDQTVALGNLGVSQAQQQAQDWYQRQQIGVAQEQNRIDQLYRTGQLSNEQYANETQRIQAQNQLHLGNAQNQIAQFNADTERGQVQNQLHLGNEQNRIDEMYKRGMLSNEQYANESQRLYQTGQLEVARQANTIDQMYKAGMLTNQQRDLALQELAQQQNDAYRYAQMAQEATLSRENMANQQRLAAMNAFGRWQAPNTRFLRSW